MKVKETIIRKSMLYKTGVEYGDYIINHVLGCSHGCQYPCYAFLISVTGSFVTFCRRFVI
ncbi:MAG: hypothetical protein UH080_06370 [Ruminococcus sp.]|nr:hypothetical protein [Ruminococcus sp.]